MARCDKCNAEGYAHVIDSTYQSYGIEQAGEPILTTTNKRFFLCATCSRKMRLEHGTERVRDYLYGVLAK